MIKLFCNTCQKCVLACLIYGQEDGSDMQKNTLDSLVLQLKKGDERAFDKLYDKTNRAVYFAIYSIVKEKNKAEDLLQDTYVTVFKRIDSYQIGTNFWNWLLTIGRRLAINSYNRQKREVLVDTETYGEQMFGSVDAEEFVSSPIILLAKQVLNEEDFNIVMLSEVAGYKRREIAEMLGQPISTITYKCNTALKKLKEVIENEDRL